MLKAGDNDLALEHALLEYNRRPQNIDVNEMVAWVYYNKGEYAKALPYLQAALRTGTKNPVVLSHAGLIGGAGQWKKDQVRGINTYPRAFGCGLCRVFGRGVGFGMSRVAGRTLFLFLLFIAAVPMTGSAHTINYALEKAPVQNVVWFYLRLGVSHIIPYGLDHILFVVSLCLLSTRIKTILWQATAFTVAHSITLALSMKNIIVAPGAVVEPIISLSILFVAVENLAGRAQGLAGVGRFYVRDDPWHGVCQFAERDRVAA